jgi:hypothetical protein
MTDLERKVRLFLAIVPTTPEQFLETTGEFWLAIARLRTEIKILDAMKEVKDAYPR